MAESKRLRATADNTPVSRARYSLYRAAYRRVNQAIADGYFLEAVTIIESLISDRLASRLVFLKSDAKPFEAIGRLLTQLRAQEFDEHMISCFSDVESWARERNYALHEMAKLQHGKIEEDWETRYLRQKEVAVSGKSLLEKIDRRVKFLRRAL